MYASRGRNGAPSLVECDAKMTYNSAVHQSYPHQRTNRVRTCSPCYRRDSVTFVTLPLDHADEIFPGTLKRANAARQELLWTLADADEVSHHFFVSFIPPSLAAP